MRLSWAVKLERRAAAAAAGLRVRAGVEVRLDDDAIWLRGGEEGSAEQGRAAGGGETASVAGGSGAPLAAGGGGCGSAGRGNGPAAFSGPAVGGGDLDLLLRKLGGERYVIGADGSWTPHGQRIPVAPQPSAGWMPALAFFRPAMPPAALPGLAMPRVALTLRRGGGEREANVLCTSLVELAEYAAAAPSVRLTPLRFAADAAGRALVWGAPLPALAGTRYWEAGGVCIPCGYEWTPRVDAPVLRALLGVGEGELALYREEGGCELIGAASFVPASRSAVRLRLQGVSEQQGDAR